MEKYQPAAGEDMALWINVSYIDDDVTRQEIHSTTSASDAFLNFQRRVSEDNGKTWKPFEPLDRVTLQLPEGGMVTFPGKSTYDPVLDILYQNSMRRLWPGGEMYHYEKGHDYNDHSMILENGQEIELKYEPGPDFDPENPFDSIYGVTNQAYLGQQVVVDKDGTAFFPMLCARIGQKNMIHQGGIVLMRRDPVSGEWSASNRQFISPNVSSRGLLEPDVAVLKNGNLILVCRGSNVKGWWGKNSMAHVTHPDSLEGRKWLMLSSDGGRTLSPVKEFTYDDGSRFYSPSAIHTFIRSSKNGKLYWIANIVEEVPDGNSPRYPLYIAEINEDIPAVIKNSLVEIDDRQENETEKLHLSNFSVLENRETFEIEIYITKVGQIPDHFWQGAVYKYVVSLPAR